jgi:hypothetical protein
MMKILITFAAFFLIAVGVFLSCKKEPPRPTPTPPLPPAPPATANKPPIANAGPDVSFDLSSYSCADRVLIVELDGSGSSDPDGDIISYSWRKISGPAASNASSNSAKARVAQLAGGEYAFELSVKDPGGLVSRDTMLISVKPATPKEYDLDITINDTFSFLNNYEDCYYGAPPCEYNDVTTIQGKGTFLPLGELKVYFSEYADTAVSKYANSSFISIYSGATNRESIYGRSSVNNLKKLIQQGGGAFNGTYTITGGSATQCDPNVFKNLPPLNVTGSLDTTTRRVTLRIHGKIYF